MASVAIVYRKDKLNSRGEAPIHFRIIKDRKINYVSSGKMLHEKYWDDKKNRVRGSYPNSMRLNNYLLEKYREVNDAVLEDETNFKSLTSRKIKEHIYGKQPIDFFTFANKSITKYLAEGKIGTHDKALSILRKLKTYNNENPLFFQDINYGFLEKYERYLRTVLNNKTNTIHKDLKFFRKIFNDAIREDLIDISQSPFLRYKLQQQKTNRVYLTEEELKMIENLNLEEGSLLDKHRDMFVFAAYSGGLRVSDVLQLQWNNFDGTHIRITIRKSAQQIAIKLPNKSLEIIKKYKSNEKDYPFIFQMLPSNLDFKNLRQVDASISAATAYINKNLKIIAKRADVKKHMSFHTSRHTFATLALTKGMSIDKVSKAMGHAAIKETQIYGKIISEEMDKAMEIFNN
jgi:integrase/recombinase XerD